MKNRQIFSIEIGQYRLVEAIFENHSSIIIAYAYKITSSEPYRSFNNHAAEQYCTGCSTLNR